MLHRRGSSPRPLARSACTSRSTSSWMAATRGKNPRSDSRCDWNSCRVAFSCFASPSAARLASTCFAISLQDRTSASCPATCPRVCFSVCSSVCFSARSFCATTSCPWFLASISRSFFLTSCRSFCMACRASSMLSSRPFSGVKGSPTLSRAVQTYHSPPRRQGMPSSSGSAATRCGRPRSKRSLCLRMTSEKYTR